MVKSLGILVLICLSGFVTRAQISILASDMPVVGDTLRYSTTPTDVSQLIALSGANKTWDASGLVPDFQDIASYKSPSSISLLYLTTFGSSTYGTKGQELPAIQGFQASDPYDFYKSGTNMLTQDGRGFSIQGIPMSQTWKDTVLRFPVTFGNADSCRFVSSEANLIVASLTHYGKRVNMVDGWGSITTPMGTFDCIRVKSVLVTIDSVKTTLLPTPIGIPMRITEYKWYAKSKKFPVLEVIVRQSPVGGGTEVRYRDRVRPEAFFGIANFTLNKQQFTSGGNDTCILTDASAHTAISRQWTITPSTYVFTGGTSAGSPNPRILFTAPGKYTVKLKVNYNAGWDDTLATDIITVEQGASIGFKASNLTPKVNEVVDFTDTSSGILISWQWEFDPTSIVYVSSSATSPNPQVKFTEAGFYTVTMNVQTLQTSSFVKHDNLIFVTGNSGLSTAHSGTMIHGFPNPANTVYTLPIDASGIRQVTIYDITGQQVGIVQSNNRIPVESFSNGYYQIVVEYQDGQIAHDRLLVQHGSGNQ